MPYIAHMKTSISDKNELMPQLDDQLCFAVYAAAHAFQHAYKPLLSRLGLTYPQYLVMMVLWEHGTISVKAIGQRLGLDSGTLSPLLKRLETAGYINRRRATEDERRVEVTLTAKGEAVREDARDIARSIAVKTGCSQEDGKALLHKLNGLRTELLSTDQE